MRTLLKLLGETIAAGGDAVLVTVVASSGSTPRGAGACMLITADGRLRGTIGGGAVEYRSEQEALEALKTRSSGVRSFRLHKNDVADLGMICGGAVDVYLRFIPGGDEAVLALTGRIETLFASGERFWLISELSGGGMTAYGDRSGFFGAPVPPELAARLTEKPARVELNGAVYYCEQLQDSGRVFIFGGGHVAQALVPALAAVGFRCVVIEDRPEFARPELFPGVLETRVTDAASAAADIGEKDYVCIMTRGHKDDYEAQKQVLKTPARYIGVIGSAHKAKAVFDTLRGDGFTEDQLGRVTTPIGLDIGGETPAEIAVSIAAQLIMVRAGRGTEPGENK